MRTILATALALTLLLPCTAVVARALPQASPQAPATPQGKLARAPLPGQAKGLVPPPKAATPLPGDYVVGAEDVLGILFWRDADMSGDVTVRPDGMITLPLVRDIKAAGLTPTQLADRIQEAVREYVTDASVTVVVRQMNSRKVFITGEVAKPGSYPLGSSSMTVMQLIAVAGGLTEWAEGKSITLTRIEDGQARAYPFDYPNVAKGTKATQNLVLKPGDTVVVPER